MGRTLPKPQPIKNTDFVPQQLNIFLPTGESPLLYCVALRQGKDTYIENFLFCLFKKNPDEDLS